MRFEGTRSANRTIRCRAWDPIIASWKLRPSQQDQLICPTGCFSIWPFWLSSPFRKNISLSPSGKSKLRLAPSRLFERGVRVVTNVGAGCGGRDGVARRAAPARTAKSCGPDAPTLVSSWRSNPPMTVANKPGHRGARSKPLKPLRGECRLIAAYLWRLRSCASSFRTRGYGCELRTRHSLRPLLSRVFFATTRALFARRECGGVDIALRNKRIPSW